MRRAIAFLLVLIFSSMLMAPLFASDPDANLPACCRRHGKHQCAMHMAPKDGRTGFISMREKCPCFPAGTYASHSPVFQPKSGAQSHAALLSAPLVVPPIEAGFRSAFPRSHLERGPPTPDA